MGKKGYFADMFSFLVKIILVILICGAIAQTRLLAKAIWEFCVTTDKGYMWVINMAIAMAVAIVIWNKQRTLKIPFRIIVCAFVFIVILCVSEIVLWHASEIWTLISAEISEEKVEAVLAMIIISELAYIIHVWIPIWADDESEKARRKKGSNNNNNAN